MSFALYAFDCGVGRPPTRPNLLGADRALNGVERRLGQQLLRPHAALIGTLADGEDLTAHGVPVRALRHGRMETSPALPEASSDLAQDVNRQRRFLDALQSATVFLYRMPSALNLTRPGFPTQLCHQLKELPDAGRTERMTLGLEAA